MLKLGCFCILSRPFYFLFKPLYCEDLRTFLGSGSPVMQVRTD